MRNKSLLLVGRAYSHYTRIPLADATWTTLATLNDNHAIRYCPNLLVWDNHDDTPNPLGVEIYDIRKHWHRWQSVFDIYGPVFANQYCYMLADVCNDASPFAHVTLFGMGAYDAEHIHQFQYITFFLGYLQALGVSHTIYQPSAILRPSAYQIPQEAPNE